MDNSELLNMVHKRMMKELVGRSTEQSTALKLKKIIEADQELRKVIADLYIRLSELGDNNMAANILSDHVAIMVDMINSFKGHR